MKIKKENKVYFYDLWLLLSIILLIFMGGSLLMISFVIYMGYLMEKRHDYGMIFWCVFLAGLLIYNIHLFNIGSPDYLDQNILYYIFFSILCYYLFVIRGEIKKGKEKELQTKEMKENKKKKKQEKHNKKHKVVGGVMQRGI